MSRPRLPYVVGLSTAEKIKRHSRDDGNCRVWAGALDRKGYGRVSVNKQVKFAHRVAWELQHGPIPAGKEVCHRCDNPACLRVDHLFLGTHRENMQDMARKLRSGCRKLSPYQVRAIRSAAGTNVALAAEYGVTDVMISAIRRGKAWEHVNA